MTSGTNVESVTIQSEQSKSNEVEEIIKNLNEKYSSENVNEYAEYLDSINLEVLPSNVLNSELQKLEYITEQFKSKKYSFSSNDVFWTIYWAVVEIFTTRALIFSNLNGGRLIFQAIIVAIDTICLASSALKIIKDYRAFKKDKKKKSVYFREIAEKIKSVLTRSESLKALEKLSQKQKDISNNLIKQIGEQELADRITEIERKILLLPKEDEKDFQESLQEALAKYRMHKEILETPSVGGITLILKSKLENLRELNHDLDEIESKLNNKGLFIKKEEFIERLEKETASYLANIKESDYKSNQILYLMQNLGYILENSSDLSEQIMIQEKFALCFWETMKYIDSKETVLNFLRPVFWDRIILFGEQELDNLEQTIEVLGIRAELLSFKNSTYYNKREYLEKLIYYVKALTHKYNSNISRSLTQVKNENY